jgi:hypothetical protein
VDESGHRRVAPYQFDCVSRAATRVRSRSRRADLWTGLAAAGSPERRRADERLTMKAVVTLVVLSENRAEGLVRPAFRSDGHGGSRDAPVLQPPLRWGTPRRKTARPGPSPGREWMLCDSGELARTSRTSRNSSHPASDTHACQRAEPCLGRVLPSAT